MADNINFREAEYVQVSQKLFSMHENQIQNINTAISGIRNLVNGADGFQAKQTSAKIDSMLDTLNTDIVALLEKVFEASETSMSAMAETVINTDTSCG